MPKANKERFNHSFVNMLIFKYNLSTEIKIISKYIIFKHIQALLYSMWTYFEFLIMC